MKLFHGKLRRRVGKKNRDEKPLYESEHNQYYAMLSERFAFIRNLLIVVLAVFTAVAVASNTDSITYENMYYLLKDINSATSISGEGADLLSYSSSSNGTHSFALYKSGLASAADTGLDIFTAGGRNTLTVSHMYSKPCLSASDKYLLMYDRAGYEFSLYNSFVRVYSGKLERPIGTAVISDSGYFAVSSGDENEKNAVFLYNKRFKAVKKYYFEEFVTSVDLSDSGNILIAYTESKNGAFNSTVVYAEPKDNAFRFEETLSGEMIYKLSFIDSDRFVIVTDKNAYVYSVSGRRIGKIEFGGRMLSQFAVGNGKFALSFENDRLTHESTVFVYNRHCKVEVENSVDMKIEQLSLDNSYLYILTDKGVLRTVTGILGRGNTVFKECPTYGRILFPISEDEVLICSDSTANYISLDGAVKWD